jgi:hypothetical protein
MTMQVDSSMDQPTAFGYNLIPCRRLMDLSSSIQALAAKLGSTSSGLAMAARCMALLPKGGGDGDGGGLWLCLREQRKEACTLEGREEEREGKRGRCFAERMRGRKQKKYCEHAHAALVACDILSWSLQLFKYLEELDKLLHSIKSPGHLGFKHPIRSQAGPTPTRTTG